MGSRRHVPGGLWEHAPGGGRTFLVLVDDTRGLNWESRGRRPRLSSKEEKKRFRPSDNKIDDLSISCWSEDGREPYGIPTPML
jgi:hypothetical protein